MSRFLLAVVASTVLLASMVGPGAAQEVDSRESTLRFGAAVSTQSVTQAKLRILGDAFTCPEARFVAYRRSTTEPQYVDEWYVASQLWSDAVLLAASAPVLKDMEEQPPDWRPLDTRCHVDKGFTFLDRLWDYTTSGYFPRSNAVGTQVEGGARFGDDNALAGLALLAASDLANDPFVAQRYRHAAERQADFLRDSALWDQTFGGGFWWNTGRGDSAEGKPAQTNALAALFFARLYAATGRDVDREWALRGLLWLDTILYDPGRQLYRWSVAYSDIEHRSGSVISERNFNYDQGIGIEAELAGYAIDRDPARLRRAHDVGEAIMSTFWSDALGSFNLERGIQQVFTGFSAWTSLGHLALYRADRDHRWLDYARKNANGLSARLRAPDGGYGVRAYVCVDTSAPGCETGKGRIVVEQTVDGAAQAWAQHLETVLAESLAAPAVEAP